MAVEADRPHRLVEYDERDVKDFYADSVNLETGPYGSTITFGVARRGQLPNALAKMRLSPHMMKVLCLLLTQQVKAYEKQMGTINISKELAENIGLERIEVY